MDGIEFTHVTLWTRKYEVVGWGRQGKKVDKRFIRLRRNGKEITTNYPFRIFDPENNLKFHYERDN